MFPSSKVYGKNFPVYLLLCAALSGFFLLLPSPSRAAECYLDSLLKTAEEKRLSQDRQWEVLVHYKRRGSGRKSLIDDPRFFLAPDGKLNPAAELVATLKAFFRKEEKDEEHARCRFPARYAWLKQVLAIDEIQLPRVSCGEFEEALARVNPVSAALVFPTTLNNSPASMFGHTLIRIDSGKQNELLSYAVTYGANATDVNGFLYAFKGIFGHYRGYFAILPYYQKVSEYSDIEHRDMWEYQLSLTREEVLRMVMHVWEVRDIYADYYFFDENCSFDLLLLLEVARPSLRLSDEFWNSGLRFWVIPVDTIRVIKGNGLITKETFRPSQARRISAIAAAMNAECQKKALDLANRKISAAAVLEMTTAPEEKMKILDLAAELLQYRYARKQMGKEDYLKQFLSTLSARSSLGKQQADAYAINPPPRPEHGHLPAKLAAGAGYRDDHAFTEVTWRAAYHDLLDPDDGYTEGAQINFFSASARYFLKEDSLQLWQLRLIDIVSLSPRTRFFKPVSWKVNTGFDRTLFGDGKDRLTYRINPGGGWAFKNYLFGIAYVMIESDLNMSGAFKHNYSLGFGGSAGLTTTIMDVWKVNLSGKSMFYEAGDEYTSVKASLTQSFKITSNNSINISLSREKTFDRYKTDASVNWSTYLQ